MNYICKKLFLLINLPQDIKVYPTFSFAAWTSSPPISEKKSLLCVAGLTVNSTCKSCADLALLVSKQFDVIKSDGGSKNGGGAGNEATFSTTVMNLTNDYPYNFLHH